MGTDFCLKGHGLLGLFSKSVGVFVLGYLRGKTGDTKI